MIENEQKAEAVKAVTALARFFRISLSKGKSIITVRDELEHVRNYLMIQHMRFKNKFTYEIQAEDGVLAVSYTHLDVYKRQVFMSLSSRGKIVAVGGCGRR